MGHGGLPRLEKAWQFHSEVLLRHISRHWVVGEVAQTIVQTSTLHGTKRC